MYIYIYIILLVIFIITIEIINHFNFTDTFNNDSNSNIKKKDNTINKSNSLFEKTKFEDSNDIFHSNYIVLNNEDTKLILFNSIIRCSPLEKLNVKHNKNTIELIDFIGKIYFRIEDKYIDFINIFFNVGEDWSLINIDEKVIYNLKIKTNIKIIYLTSLIKNIEILTNF